MLSYGAMVDGTAPRYLIIDPLPPLLIIEQCQYSAALILVRAPQPMGFVGADAVQDGITNGCHASPPATHTDIAMAPNSDRPAPAPKREPDGRSRQARRYRALVAAFSRDL